MRKHCGLDIFEDYVKIFLLYSRFTKSPWKCSGSLGSQLFISITDFDIAEKDDSHISITMIDAMGKPEITKIFDKTNYNDGKMIQVGY